VVSHLINRLTGRAEMREKIAAMEAEISELRGIRDEHLRWSRFSPVIDALMAEPDIEQAKIISTDQGQYSVGTANAATRDAWVEEALKRLPKGARLLDAGAGECQYRRHCGHLDYVSQDVAVYDGTSSIGLQNTDWTFGAIDIVCDIVAIPEPDASFDAILCTEVLEHLPDPVRALGELARLLKPKGELIITAPFWSLTHQAPFHFATGFNRFFYEHHLRALGLDIIELTPNGNFFECMGQELRRIKDMARRFTDQRETALEAYALQVLLSMCERLSANDRGSAEMLHYDFQVRALKSDAG
jgi:ubiquinone/menaquinone biosynthesis C-methylase UbiE